jgi:hypothetical protein
MMISISPEEDFMPRNTPQKNTPKNSKTTGKTNDVREPNAQNSELDPQVHPSGARIERMKEDVDRAKGEREANYEPTHDTAEGSREDVPEAPHRQTPESR